VTARFLSEPDSGEERWALDSSDGCCTFDLLFEDGRAVVEFDGACHGCLNELNALALERAYVLRRRAPTP
jgi:hypothetical protein